MSLLALGAWWQGMAAGTPEVPAPAPAVAHTVASAPATAARPAPAMAPSMEALPAADLVRVLALQQDRHGRWLARLQVGNGAPRLAQVGDGLARGVRVERITADGVTVRRGAQLEQLPAEGRVARREAPPEPLPALRTTVIALPPGQQAPSRDAVERAIGRALERAAPRPVGESTGR
ncbi:hypothetical protein QRD43_17450 [Pelomonas sp. APW6]|uniref:Type II secretion system protein GspC N-terminal domain-containing protein n=1 Tax=Roseateles subflavus TaxID=3053353 RepID=A0ABT7LNH3_9BURK|nr:hypothetical protein [Pelomonas sp. APW6]MDL5033700.1 hypothetical protein [Pelomonas sp. APW6]